MEILPIEIINIINQYLLFKQSIRFLSINKNLFYSEIRNNLLIRSCLQIAYVCGIHDGYIHGTNIYNRALNSKFNLDNYVYSSLKCRRPKKKDIEFESWKIMDKLSLKLTNHLKNKF